MSSRFAVPHLTPAKYAWCKKHIIVAPPWVGDPYPPAFQIYVAYQLQPYITPAINVQGQGNIRRLAPLVKYQGTFDFTFGNVTCSAQVTMERNYASDLWSIDIFAYRFGIAGPPLAMYNVFIPNLWKFRFSAPPWDLTHPTIRTDLLWIRSGP